MTRAVLLLLLLIGAWWSLLLLEWVAVDKSGIIGAELNQTMALLPAVAVLAVLMSLYRKMPRLLVALGSMAIAATSAIALLGDLATSPAVIEAREQVSGIAGGGAVALELSPVIYVFAFAGFTLAIAAALLIFLKPGGRSVESVNQDLDARDLWDEQSE
ncbi:MAG: hypothetical protein O3C16_01825 [Actinobacteria bacterium]|nr:hypothetical protein [Actinomycetota bacterium]